MQATVAVTGGTGFIGKHLVKRLVDEGHSVKCLVRETSDITYLKDLGIKLIYGDILEARTLPSLVEQVEAVFHLAGQVSVSQSIEEPLSTFFINTVGTLNLLEALRSKNSTNCLLVYISTDRVYGNPKSQVVKETDSAMPLEPYAVSKLSAEQLCLVYSKTYSIPFVIIRGANVYGPGQEAKLFIPSVIHQIFSGKEDISVGNLDTYRNFVYVEDVVEALYLILLQPSQVKNEIFNIGERTAKLADIIDILLKLSLKYLGKTFQVFQSPSLVRPSETESKKYELDCSKAYRLLGWSPKFSLDRGLEETIKIFLHEKRGTNRDE